MDFGNCSHCFNLFQGDLQDTAKRHQTDSPDQTRDTPEAQRHHGEGPSHGSHGPATVGYRCKIPGSGEHVFPTPSTAVLNAKTHEQASQLNRETIGKGISIQTWNLVPQIRQIRESLHPEDANQFFECHPETSFCELAKHSLSSKKTPEGCEQRINLLRRVIPDIDAIVQTLPKKCKVDDALDAFAAAWSAKRYAQNKAIIIGGHDYDNDGYPIRVII